jgi:hypothetical protein
MGSVSTIGMEARNVLLVQNRRRVRPRTTAAELEYQKIPSVRENNLVQVKPFYFQFFRKDNRIKY